MGFKIVTWNMGFWQRQDPDKQRKAWQYLRELGADVALLQEAFLPEALRTPEGAPPHVVNDPATIDKHRPWASMIVSWKHELEPVSSVAGAYRKIELPLDTPAKGFVQIARVNLVGHDPIVVASIYGMFDEGGYADTTMHRILSDLTPMFDGPAWERLIVGGDLNVSTQTDGVQRQRDKTVFDRLAALGMVDLLALNNPKREPLEGCWCDDAGQCLHVHTHRHNRSQRPWHNDYIFSSKPLSASASAYVAEPWNSDEDLSDHLPVVAEFELR